MFKTNPQLVKKCKALRRKGFTLGEIIKNVNLPKTTVYGHIYNVPFSFAGKKRLEKVRQKIVKENIRKINEFNKKARKGKCASGRIIIKPKKITNELVFLVAHFMFDGEVQSHSCIYHNRSKVLVDKVEFLMKKIFKLNSINRLNLDTGVYRASYHYVELADYIRSKIKELKKYIKETSLAKKKIFLRAFFDDEGNVKWRLNQKLVKGYQHDLETLELIQSLLKDFNIESKIDKKYKEIIISRKENIVKFRDKINFSKGIYINPNRKNSVWKKKLEKRYILENLINSYKI